MPASAPFKVIPSSEQAEDFRLALDDHSASFERTMERLRACPTDGEALASLFRIAHTLKGDASLCGVHVFVPLLHALESILSRVREKQTPFSAVIGKLVFLVMDTMQNSVAALQGRRMLEVDQLGALEAKLSKIASAPAAFIEQTAHQAVHGGHSIQYAFDTIVSAQSDLTLFRQLADQLDARSPALRGRSLRVVQLAQRSNELAREPIDATQLEAAALLHDLGMMFLPDALWLKPGILSDSDRRAVRAHPALGSAILERIPGWKEAARMVLEHHEMPSGRGYPNGLTTAQICPGAKLLAIIDAFESVMLKQSNRGRTRSFIRAIAEVNANTQQFAQEWLDPFNRAARDVLKV